MRHHLMPQRITLAALSAIMLVLAGCSGAGSDNAAKNHANNSNNAELFTIPSDQMSHVQVLTLSLRS